MTGRNSKKLVVTVYKSQQVRLVCLIAIIVTNSITTIVERVGAEELLLLRMMGGKMTKLIGCCISIFLFLFLQIAAYASVSDDELDAPSQSSNIKLDTAQDKRPNILLIVIDDLGYSDMGVFGGEIGTPNLDKLAHSGVRHSNFYTSTVCSPTRAMLLSGTDNHLAGLGSMKELLLPQQLGKPGYEGYLNFGVVTLAELIRDAGYHTYMTGKWHLGLTPELDPTTRGFERAFALAQGASGHFNDMGGPWAGGKAVYREDGKRIKLPDDYYSTKTFTEKMMEYIENNKDDNKPFFGYLAYSAVHWPLQAPAESIALYEGKYDGGYDVLRNKRLEKLKKLNLVSQNIVAASRPAGVPAWHDLSPEIKMIESRKMEIYAAMVHDIDVYMGDLIDYLKDIGELENTFIFVMSDNGAAGSDLNQYRPVREMIESCCNNSYENMGKPDSFLWYGAGWAWAGTSPFDFHKDYTAEGGIKASAITFFQKLDNHGIISPAFSTVMDVMPTLIDMAGIAHPGTNYEGRKVFPLKGKSMLSHLEGRSSTVHPADYVMGWEMSGMRAIRQGDWKITYLPSLIKEGVWYGKGPWKLYNLANDPTEQNDLATAYPDKLRDMKKLWERYQKENNVILMDDIASH